MKIGTLITGAGVVTTFAGQARCDMFMTIGDVDTANPLSAIQVEVGGKTILNINSAALITAWMKYLCETAGAGVVGLVLKFSTGEINQSTTYRLTNAGVTVPDIYVFSTAPKGVPLEVSSKTINAQSVESFERFSALFIETPANIAYAEIMFMNGHAEQLAAIDIDSLFTLTNQTETNGRLGTVSVIDNSKQTIKSVKIYTNAVGACTVLVGKLPDAIFKTLS